MGTETRCVPDSELAPHLRRCDYNQGFESCLIISTVGSYLVAAFVACLTLWITVWHPPLSEHCYNYHQQRTNGTTCIVRLQSGGFMHTVFHRSVAELWVKWPSVSQWLTFICDCLTLPSERTPVCNHYRLHVTKFKLLSTNTAQLIATQCFSNNIWFPCRKLEKIHLVPGGMLFWRNNSRLKLQWKYPPLVRSRSEFCLTT